MLKLEFCIYFAGKYWLYSFQQRHPDLSLRSPQKCSIARLTSFTRDNVNVFYQHLKHVLQEHPEFSDGSRIYNLDETGVTTVMGKATKIFAKTGARSVHVPTAAERGSLITLCCIICANGTHIPPAMIFPRVKVQDNMMIGAFPGTKPLATTSGWMNAELFLDVLKHFVRQTNCSPSK